MLLLVGAATFQSNPVMGLGIVVFLVGLGMALLREGPGKSEGSTEGRTRRPVPAPLRRKIFIRAGGRCQFRGCSVKGATRLHIHHIDMDRSNSNDEDNLIAICPNHHHEIHNDPSVTTLQVRAWARGRYVQRESKKRTKTASRRRGGE